MSKKEKEVKVFKGKVTRPFTIQGKGKSRKAVEYNVGDSFETKNEKFFQSLIQKKRIRA